MLVKNKGYITITVDHGSTSTINVKTLALTLTQRNVNFAYESQMLTVADFCNDIGIGTIGQCE